MIDSYYKPDNLHLYPFNNTDTIILYFIDKAQSHILVKGEGFVY